MKWSYENPGDKSTVHTSLIYLKKEGGNLSSEFSILNTFSARCKYSKFLLN